MPESVDTWIVVPCFNEAARLDATAFTTFVQTHTSIGFLFVDDGCTDGTREVLEGLCHECPAQLKLLVLATNEGKAEAVRRGLLSILGAHPVVVGFWDADLAVPLQEIDACRAVLDRRRDVDIVLGVRLRMLGHRIYQSQLRRCLGRVFTSAASITLGRRFRDTQCGAKLFRVTPVLQAALDEPFRSRWVFDVELLLRCRVDPDSHGNRFPAVYEYPLETWTGKAHSKLKPWAYGWCAAELLGILLRDRMSSTDAWRPTRPTRKRPSQTSR